MGNFRSREDASTKYLVQTRPQQPCGPPPERYVVQYDFSSNVTSQLDVFKGAEVEKIKDDETREWCEVKILSSEKSGWIPKSYISPRSSLEANDWFHGDVSRATVKFLLSEEENGTFLVRKGISFAGTWSLSVLKDGEVEHFRIRNNINGEFFVSQDKKFKSLSALVQYYSTHTSEDLPLLKKPAPKKIKPTLYSPSPGYDDWEFKQSDLDVEGELGQGSFGIVLKATWKKFDKTVALKTLKAGPINDVEFHKEVKAMKSIKHPNLVQLLGVCTTERPYLLMSEFMCSGNLSEYLGRREQSELSWVVLLYMATQVVMGMEYLEERNYTHRDLAARNCFVGENNTVKVGDFGLSRFSNDGIYQGGERCLFPVRWTAPEGLLDHKFSSKSDVWSFGVLLWEISTLGKEVPYQGKLGALLPLELAKGYRLECPSSCPQPVYDLMKECWAWKPENRPKFSRIRLKLNAISEEVRIKDSLIDAVVFLKTFKLLLTLLETGNNNSS